MPQLIDQTTGEIIALKKGSERCGAWAMLCQCEVSDEHKFAKRLYCGREWCSVCGKEDSAMHRRRVARLLPKVMQLETMGYMVIEFPKRYRKIAADDLGGLAWCYSKDDLKDTANRIIDVLAGKRKANKWRNGGYFSRGLLRWHWFGDVCINSRKNICRLTGEPCPKNRCERFVNNGDWNPHANILVDSGYIPKATLEKIKKDLRYALCCPDLIVNYSYTDNPGQKYNRVKYIARPTFKHYEWEPYMAEQLYNFRNQRWWGKWNGGAVWELDKVNNEIPALLEIEKLRQGICPDCGAALKTLRVGVSGKPVKYAGPIDATWLQLWGSEEMAGAGYYRVYGESCAGSPCDVLMDVLDST